MNIEDYFIQRELHKALSAKFKGLRIKLRHPPKYSHSYSRRKNPFSYRMVVLEGRNTHLFLSFAIGRSREEIRKLKREKREYCFDVKIIDRKCEVRKDKIPNIGECYAWRSDDTRDDEDEEGYLNIGYTENPDVSEKLKEFDREVLGLERQGKILSRQEKESVRAREKVGWESEREEIKQRAGERWGRDKNKSCPECDGEGEKPHSYGYFEKCEICRGSGEIESLEMMEYVFLSRQRSLESITKEKWFEYEQQRLEQMKELGLRKPSYQARVYIKVVERKK